ncbi:MAG: SPFH domain-containing protein [Candidatus Accumulibacter sp.]|jgi:membrane protease subunit (stomatin/prohibitin family)|nr:SPFH domain-containing protein [Accumulibacter sp.]
MTLMNFIKKQFIDVIQWNEESDGILACRYPMADAEIQNGARLTVRDSQMALFVDEGRVADAFGPGLYTLNTRTLPVLTNLKNWDKLFNSPFKSDVYFFSTRLQLERTWGTPNPITLRDKEFGVVRMRAFGIYSYKLSDPVRFYKEISGSREIYSAEDVDGHLRNLVISAITALFGDSGISFIDMASKQGEFESRLKAALESVFERYGLSLDNFTVQNISLPEELQKSLDMRIGMNMVGDVGQYSRYQTANSIPLAAQNEGGLSGAGAGLGAGLGIGQAMAQAMMPGLETARAPALAPGNINPGEIAATLEKLYELTQKGILTQAEFDSKKTELLNKLL